MTDEKEQTLIPEEILGISENDENSRVYFRHASGTTVFSVTQQASIISKLLTSTMLDSNDIDGKSEDNPLVFNVDNGTDDIFEFIQSYMEYFEGKTESNPPPKPLPNNTHISAILHDEYILFSDIVNENDTLKVKIETFNKYIIVALYFDIKHLATKLAAIVASLIQTKSLTQLKTLLGASN
jgi:hypothetical protein